MTSVQDKQIISPSPVKKNILLYLLSSNWPADFKHSASSTDPLY
jgi:hypothetical protein